MRNGDCVVVNPDCFRTGGVDRGFIYWDDSNEEIVVVPQTAGNLL